MTGRRLVIGIGNRYRADDGVGPVVAERVASRLPPSTGSDVDVLAGVADPLDLLGRWDDADLAVVVDAVRSGAPAGTVTVVELADDTTSPGLAPGSGPARGAGVTSTHGLGTIAAVRVARALGAAPRRIVLVTVEGAAFGHGDVLSPAVEAAADDAVAVVLDELVAGDGAVDGAADAAPGQLRVTETLVAVSFGAGGSGTRTSRTPSL